MKLSENTIRDYNFLILCIHLFYVFLMTYINFCTSVHITDTGRIYKRLHGPDKRCGGSSNVRDARTRLLYLKFNTTLDCLILSD